MIALILDFLKGEPYLIIAVLLLIIYFNRRVRQCRCYFHSKINELIGSAGAKQEVDFSKDIAHLKELIETRFSDQSKIIENLVRQNTDSKS